MKLKTYIFSTAIAVILAASAGCKKEKFDINSNPNDVTDGSVTPSVLLPGALQATSTLIAADFWWTGWWMGHGARSGSFQSFNEDETYKFTNDFHTEVWNDLYNNANNYNLMITKAKALGQGTYQAIGLIMKSHNFQILTDYYGNIPYSEAYKGTAVATPKYDKGIDIYKGIFTDLDTAIALLNNTALSNAAANPDIAAADLVFQGNTTAWKRFANTLRLRMLVHLYNGVNTNTVVSGIDIPAQVAKITSDGFIGAGQSAHLNPGFVGTKPNPYFRFFVTNEAGTGSQRDWARASQYAIEYYKYNGDYRIGSFYVAPVAITNTTSPTGVQQTNFISGHTGIVFGTPSGAGVLTGAQISTVRGPGLVPTGATSRAWIFTSVESLFLQAEARHRGIITTGLPAKNLLEAGIKESFVWLDAKRPPLRKRDPANPGDSIVYTPSQTADGYMALNAGYPDVDYTAPAYIAGDYAGGLFTILSQKWFALNSIAPYEIWTDYRRTDVVYGRAVDYTPGPTLSVDPGRTSTTIPRRLFYPQNEYNYNAKNVAAEGTINVFTGKIFWDLN